MRIQCKTLFDCSYTGVTGSFRTSMIPFEDRAGQPIHDLTAWNRSRNQQRNWETLLQILGLRTQPMDLVMPVYQDGAWKFEFAIESEGVYTINNNADPLAGLLNDCDGVPMLTGLTEKSGVERTISTHGADQNIWFLQLNNTLE
jgi:hypothetical protein